MHWIFKTLLILFSIVAGLALVIIGFVFFSNQKLKWEAEDYNYGPAPLLQVRGFEYRDLNKNGRLDIYEDHRKSVEDRVEDLLSQMTIEEKAAQLFHPFLFSTEIENPLMKLNGLLNPEASILLTKGISHVVSALGPEDPAVHARWANRVQQLAEQTRLGIPVTISSDPKHSDKIGASSFMKGFSQWPDPLGFGALRDSLLVYEFANIARQEYRAVGIHASL